MELRIRGVVVIRGGGVVVARFQIVMVYWYTVEGGKSNKLTLHSNFPATSVQTTSFFYAMGMKYVE